MHDHDLIKAGQGRCSKELAFNAKVWFSCVLLCVSFMACAMITGCNSEWSRRLDPPRTRSEAPAEVLTEKEAARILRRQFNGL